MSQEIDIKMVVKYTEREKERSRLHKKSDGKHINLPKMNI